jgi:hypothetical protein
VADAAQQYAGNFEGGIKAFHGSPHSFERFDLSKIGTARAQAMGTASISPRTRAWRAGIGSASRDPTIDGQPVDWATRRARRSVVAGYNGSRNAAIRDLAGQCIAA